MHAWGNQIILSHLPILRELQCMLFLKIEKLSFISALIIDKRLARKLTYLGMAVYAVHSAVFLKATQRPSRIVGVIKTLYFVEGE